MSIHTNIGNIIGHTPLVALKRFVREKQGGAKLLGKVESRNPAGSVKDRIAKAMLDDARERGVLHEDAVIIEPTSGNTGIALAALAAAGGYRLILTMPETMSVERRNLLTAYGAEIVLTPGDQGMRGAIREAERLAEKYPNAFLPGQFDNPVNPKAHYETTGPEIWKDTEGQVNVLVAGVGTGGTITGVGRYLKEKNPAITVVAVEPAQSQVLAGEKPGSHLIQGIGANFVPSVLDRTVLDEIIPVEGRAAMATTKELAVTEGLLCGISAGAALWAAVQLTRREAYRDKTVVVILPDGGERYMSTPLFEK